MFSASPGTGAITSFAEAGCATGCWLPVQRSTLTAEKAPWPTGRFGGWPSVRFLQQPVGQDQPGAVFGRGSGPNGVILAAVVLGGVAMLKSPKLVPRPLSELQLLEMLLKEMLAATFARQHGALRVMSLHQEPTKLSPKYSCRASSFRTTTIRQVSQRRRW